MDVEERKPLVISQEEHERIVEQLKDKEERLVNACATKINMQNKMVCSNNV